MAHLPVLQAGWREKSLREEVELYLVTRSDEAEEAYKTAGPINKIMVAELVLSCPVPA
jgi:hypothetical protein